MSSTAACCPPRSSGPSSSASWRPAGAAPPNLSTYADGHEPSGALSLCIKGRVGGNHAQRAQLRHAACHARGGRLNPITYTCTVMGMTEPDALPGMRSSRLSSSASWPLSCYALAARSF